MLLFKSPAPKTPFPTGPAAAAQAVGLTPQQQVKLILSNRKAREYSDENEEAQHVERMEFLKSRAEERSKLKDATNKAQENLIQDGKLHDKILEDQAKTTDARGEWVRMQTRRDNIQ
jgi:hypothetical protein